MENIGDDGSYNIHTPFYSYKVDGPPSSANYTIEVVNNDIVNPPNPERDELWLIKENMKVFYEKKLTPISIDIKRLIIQASNQGKSKFIFKYKKNKLTKLEAEKICNIFSPFHIYSKISFGKIIFTW